MPLLGIFNIVMLAMGLFAMAFAAGCLILLIVGCFLRNRVLIIVSLAVPALLVTSVFVISSANEARDPFPQLETPAVGDLLPGTYVLDPTAFEYLKSRGFDDFSAEITLNPDKTFQVSRMPHIWVSGTENGSGYDNCSGTWSVGKAFNGSRDTSNVTLQWMPTPHAGKSIPPGSWVVFLGISGPKGERKDYALSVPIFTGDFDYIWFVRRSR